MKYCILALLIALIGTFSTLTPAWAQTVEIIDQIPTNGYPGGFISDTECTSSGPLLRASFADDFRIQPPAGYSAMAVSSVEFIGRYQPATAPNDPTPFIIQFRQDASGLPGPVIARPNAGITQVQLGVGVYGFTATFAPVTLGAGIYWLEVVEDGNASNDCWGWVIGPLDAANGRDGGAHDVDFDGPAGWLPQFRPDSEGDNVAMRLFGSAAMLGGLAIPALDGPGLAMLAGLLWLGAFVAFFRRKNGD